MQSSPDVEWHKLVLPIGFCGAWQLLAYAEPASQFFFSSPIGVAAVLVRLGRSGQLFSDAGVTVFEAVTGFLIGTGSGALIGLMLWYFQSFSAAVRPSIVALSAVPMFALAPVVIVWFGVGIFAKVMVAALSTVFVAIMQAQEGASRVSERQMRLVTILGASRWQAFKVVVVPSAAIWIMNSMRLNVGFALAGAFVGEIISADRGLGYFITRSAGLYNMTGVLAGCSVLMVTAVGLNQIVSLIGEFFNVRRTAET